MLRRTAALVALTLAASLAAAVPASAGSAVPTAVASAGELTISPDRTTFVTNRDWSGSWGLYQAEISGGWHTYDMQWSLYDAAGGLVVGPQTVVTDGGAPTRAFRFYPMGDDGPALVAGTYQAEFTVTLKTNGGGTEIVTDTVPVTMVDNPPADDPRLISADRINRHASGTNINYARFRLEVYQHTWRPGVIRLRDRTGRGVASREIGNPCFGAIATDKRCTATEWDIEVPSFSYSRVPIRPGTYTAEFTMPDSWGRPMVKQLGEVYVQARKRLSRIVTLSPAAAESPSQVAGRCSSVRKPGPHKWSGSVGLLSLSRCGSRRGTADLAQKTFAVKVPRVVGYASSDAVGFRTLGWVSTADVQLACKAAWGSSQRWSQSGYRLRGYRWSGRCPAGYGTWSDVQGRRVYLRLRVVNGQRFDVRKLRAQFDYTVWRTVR